MTTFLITAPSGAGKTTFVKAIEQQGLWKECISHTTRPMRTGEKDGVTYHFVDSETFISMDKNDKFVEKVVYNKNHYGISRDEIKRVHNSGSHAVIIVDYDGYSQVKSIYPDAIGIFLYATKEDCMINMLSRGDSLNDALERINKYDKEISNKIDFDYIIKNVRGKQYQTKAIIENIIKQYDISKQAWYKSSQ